MTDISHSDCPPDIAQKSPNMDMSFYSTSPSSDFEFGRSISPNQISPDTSLDDNEFPPSLSVTPNPNMIQLENIDIPSVFFFNYYAQVDESEAEHETSSTIILQKAADTLSKYVNVPNTDMFAHLCGIYNLFQLDEEV